MTPDELDSLIEARLQGCLLERPQILQYVKDQARIGFDPSEPEREQLRRVSYFLWVFMADISDAMWYMTEPGS